MVIVQCETCPRVRVGTRWLVVDGAQVVGYAVVGTCPTCLAWRKRVSEAKYRREGRELLQRRAKGYGGPAPGEDIWRGFREGE